MPGADDAPMSRGQLSHCQLIKMTLPTSRIFFGTRPVTGHGQATSEHNLKGCSVRSSSSVGKGGALPGDRGASQCQRRAVPSPGAVLIWLRSTHAAFPCRFGVLFPLTCSASFLPCFPFSPPPDRAVLEGVGGGGARKAERRRLVLTGVRMCSPFEGILQAWMGG